MKIVVYTALWGKCGDVIAPPETLAEIPGVDIEYVCFTDQPIESPGPYQLRTIPWTNADSRRVSRWPKINSHLVFPDADITVWHDAVYQLKDLSNLMSSLVSGWEFCSYVHPRRLNIRQEVVACIEQRKDNYKILSRQLNAYQGAGLPVNSGLFENTCLIRRNTPKIAEINTLWWEEYQKWSCRDQVSLPYVFWKLGYTGWKPIPGNRLSSLFFNFREHDNIFDNVRTRGYNRENLVEKPD